MQMHASMDFTKAELLIMADDLNLDHDARMSKAELVELINLAIETDPLKEIEAQAPRLESDPLQKHPKFDKFKK